VVIYRWTGAEGSADYVGKTEDDDRKLNWNDKFRGTPLPSIEEWEAPLLTQYRGEQGTRALRKVTDTSSSASSIIISELAAIKLREFWDRHTALYPVVLEDVPSKPFYLVVVTTELDCLDRQASEGKLQKYGPTPDLFAYVETWHFNEQCVGDNDLFTIPDSKTMIYVSERFKESVADAGLKGFCLKREYWDPDPWLS
jgi:hypothetical protein